MKRINLLLCVAAILALALSCTNSLIPPKVETSTLTISVGLSSDGARMTYAPVFNDPPLSTFAKLNLTVTQGGNELANENRSITNQESITIELEDLPYGSNYTITAKAYLDAEDLDTAYAAMGTKVYSFNSSSSHTSLTLGPVVSTGTGTLNYTLTDPDPSGPVAANLYKYVAGTVKGTLQSALVVDAGVHTLSDVPAGYYLLEFGNNVPSIVHIYKDLETTLSETNTIFGLSANAPDGVSISLSPTGKVRGGATVTITVTGQYVPGSLKLNGGADDSSFTGSEQFNSGTYTRTFTMPNKSVVVSASHIPPEIEIEFETLNQHANLRFWSVTGGNPDVVIWQAGLGQQITIRAFESPGDSGSTSIPLAGVFWYLDNERQPSADNQPNFTVPSGTDAVYVGAIVSINGVPHAVAIPINN